MSKPTSCILWSPVSTMRAAICTEPTRLAVGATTRWTRVAATPHLPASHAATSAGGSWRASSVSTATVAASA